MPLQDVLDEAFGGQNDVISRIVRRNTGQLIRSGRINSEVLWPVISSAKAIIMYLLYARSKDFFRIALASDIVHINNHIINSVNTPYFAAAQLVVDALNQVASGKRDFDKEDDAKPWVYTKPKELLSMSIDDMWKMISDIRKEADSKALADNAMVHVLRKDPTSKTKVPSAPTVTEAQDVGGIDLNQINVNRTGNVIKVNFDPAQLNELLQGGFEGFAPVIINIKPIDSPFPLLGLAPRKEEERLAKV